MLYIYMLYKCMSLEFAHFDFTMILPLPQLPVLNCAFCSQIKQFLVREWLPQADWRECHRQVVAQRLLHDFGARPADYGCSVVTK